MTDDGTRSQAGRERLWPRRQRAIEAYDSAREKAVDTFGEAPLIALAGGIAAGALIAALLPRTRTETRASARPRAGVKDSQGSISGGEGYRERRLDELGLNREKGEQTIRSRSQGRRKPRASAGKAALDAARNKTDLPPPANPASERS